jgi:hypothetical protein
MEDVADATARRQPEGPVEPDAAAPPPLRLA